MTRQHGLALLAGLSLSAPAAAREIVAGDAGAALELRTSLKSSLLVGRAPDDPLLFPERDAAASLWRLRLDAVARPSPLVVAAVAYEHRLEATSAGAAGLLGAGVLPSVAPGPWRRWPLDWPIAQGTGLLWRHEIDRAFVAVHAGRAELTAGRQAIGWGRGVLFGAVDLFSPFTPLEADREWRRGVDALRADVRLGDRGSVDLVAAGGESADRSIFAARLRGYAGRADAELILGRRARDLLAGITSSAAVAGAELHGEIAVFRTPDALPDGGNFGNDHVAAKAVVGGSYRLDVGNGIPLLVEYHYSGFGVRDPRDIAARLANPDFAERYLRGDFQILGRHAIALLASYEASPSLAAALLAIGTPADGSGVVSPSLTYTLSDAAVAVLNLYVPFGLSPRGPELQSEYGATPLAGFLQIRLYD